VTLQISDLHKSFPSKTGPQGVLRGVDLTVQQGELVSLIGHSGSGKSTLLNVIGGLLRPDRGTIDLDGAPITGPGPDRAMVFQSYSLLPRLSLHANVREAVGEARPDLSRSRVEELSEHYLSSVGLWEHRHKRPAQVSGGMAQRTAVARAFAVRPRLLLLDEPFGALDALTRARLQSQLIELWTSEPEVETVIMVTHGIDEAILLADRIVVMANPPFPSIRAIIDVPIPRPRDRVTIVDHPAYAEIQHRLLEILSEDSLAAA
jgi:nitrate ABC transporter ATP-binding subunit